MKKRIFAVLLVVSIVVMSALLSGCTNVTAFNLVKDAEAKTEALDGFDATMKMNIKVEAEGVNMEVPVSADIQVSGIKSDSPVMRVAMSTQIMDQKMDADMYIEGDTAYVDIMGSKYKAPMEEVGADYADQIDQIVIPLPEEVLKDVQIVENADGSKSVSVVLNHDTFTELYTDLSNSILKNTGLETTPDCTFTDIKVAITVTEDGYIGAYKISYKINMSEEVDGETYTVVADASAEVEFNNPGQTVTVTAPEGYQNYPSIDDAE